MSTREYSYFYTVLPSYINQAQGSPLSPPTRSSDRSRTSSSSSCSPPAPILLPSPSPSLASVSPRVQVHSPEYASILAQHYFNPRSAGGQQGAGYTEATLLPSPLFLDQRPLPPTLPYHPSSDFVSTSAASAILPPYFSPPCSVLPYSEDQDTSSSPIDSIDDEDTELVYAGPCKPFISKLAFILQNSKKYADVFAWDTTGTSFILASTDKCLEQVLPEIFYHSSMAALKRQLKTYTFRQLDQEEMNNRFPFTLGLDDTASKYYTAWSHPLFTRENPSTLNQMVPKLSDARKIQSVVTERTRKIKATKELKFRDQYLRGEKKQKASSWLVQASR